MQVIAIKRLVLTVASIVTLCATAVAVPTSASATAYRCGSQCNGKAASWVIPANGIRCSSSKKLIANTFPMVEHSFADRRINVKVYYSKVCQTMWATMRNTTTFNAAGDCKLVLHRWVSSTYKWHRTQCPAAGKTITSPMIDDYSASGGKAASVNLKYVTVYAPGPMDASYYFAY